MIAAKYLSMREPSDKPVLIVVLGPTASGKTALSMAIAKQLDGEIISCDSVAVYRDFELGTAKPSYAERRHIPHHLIDVADPAASAFTAGEFSRLARTALGDITSRGRTAIIAGGSGLYLRALLLGLFSGPQRSEEWRKRLGDLVDSKGASYLYRVLQRIDPVRSKTIHANDSPKLVRAIEVSMAARRPMSELWRQGRDALQGFTIFRIGLNPERSLLYGRINRRCEQMFDAGLVEETRALARKYPHISSIPNSPLNSPGYRQSLQFLRGEIGEGELVTSTQQAHRNYAKRQVTWFRREPDVQWLQGFGDDPCIQQLAFEAITRQHA